MEDTGIWINGEFFVRVSTRKGAPIVAADVAAQFCEDVAQAMVAASEAVSNTPLTVEYTRSLAPFIWHRMVTLREAQVEALVSMQVAAGRCDASLVSMALDMKLSAVKALVKRAAAALDMAGQTDAQ